MEQLASVHRQYLRDRGVLDSIAERRGYYSIFTESDLPAGRWSGAQREMIGWNRNEGVLVIPLYHTADEDPVVHQLRPGNPRPDMKGGHIKFEVPSGTCRGSAVGELPADVHPDVLDIVSSADPWEHLSEDEGDLWVVQRGVSSEVELDAWVAKHPDTKAAEVISMVGSTSGRSVRKLSTTDSTPRALSNALMRM